MKRILIVGLGSMGQRHLEIARRLFPDADIRVLRFTQGGSHPKEANGCFSGIDEALMFAPQAAVIANPSSVHLPVALPLARIGTHLLIEKPLADTFDHAVAFKEATAPDLPGIILVGYNLRFRPSLQAYRNAIRSGSIGQVLSVRCEVGQNLLSWRPKADYRKTVSASRSLGGGVLLELSHEIDYIRWIFGNVEWVQALLCSQGNLDTDVEDTAHLLLGFVSTGIGKHLVANLNMDFIRHDTTRSCVAIGESGSLRWNALTGEVHILQQGATSWGEVYSNRTEAEENYFLEWRHFLECIDGKSEPLISVEDGMAVLRIVEAARQSSTDRTMAFVAR